MTDEDKPLQLASSQKDLGKNSFLKESTLSASDLKEQTLSDEQSPSMMPRPSLKFPQPEKVEEEEIDDPNLSKAGRACLDISKRKVEQGQKKSVKISQ